jgi:hypothetical protein
MVGTSQVYSAQRRIKTTKSPGPDNIPNKILKTFAFEFAPVILIWHLQFLTLLQGISRPPEKIKTIICGTNPENISF